MSRQSCSDAQFLGLNKMRYEAVLGQVLRDVRLQAGLALTDCVAVLTAANLSQIENGLAVIQIESLVGLCEVLGVAPSDVFLLVEARRSGLSVEDQIAVSTARLGALLDTSSLAQVATVDAVRTIARQRRDNVRAEVMRMQREGLHKQEVARRLGVTVRTVQRHWPKGDE